MDDCATIRILLRVIISGFVNVFFCQKINEKSYHQKIHEKIHMKKGKKLPNSCLGLLILKKVMWIKTRL